MRSGLILIAVMAMSLDGSKLCAAWLISTIVKISFFLQRLMRSSLAEVLSLLWIASPSLSNLKKIMHTYQLV